MPEPAGRSDPPTERDPQTGPVRTCVGCRERAERVDLLRLVWEVDRVVADPQARRPGRGAYLHDRPQCWQLALRRRAVPRALRLGPERTAAAGLDELASSRRAQTAPPQNLAEPAPSA